MSRLPVSYWAQIDQLAAVARDGMDTTAMQNPMVQSLFCDTFDFLNAAKDSVELKLRILALGRLVQSIQEEQCSDSSWPGSQP